MGSDRFCSWKHDSDSWKTGETVYRWQESTISREKLWWVTLKNFNTWWVESFVVPVFKISHFSSTVCSETMAKTLQQDSGEERVTATSRPMMNLSARMPSVVSSSTSVILVKRSYGNQKSLEYNCWERGAIRPTWYRHRPNMNASDFYYHEQFMESFSSPNYSKMGWWPCLVFSRVENWNWVVRAIGATRRNFLENDTRNSTWFLSRGNSSLRNRAIRCEWSNASWQTGETRYRLSRKGMASTIRHWTRWSRIGISTSLIVSSHAVCLHLPLYHPDLQHPQHPWQRVAEKDQPHPLEWVWPNG